MKRFWLVLLSLGLIMAFSASAYAVDVKFSGNYFAAGMYLNKLSLADVAGNDGQSTSFYYQRMRLQTEFVVSPGLSLVTRANIMQRVAGASRATPATTVDIDTPSTIAENQNIGFDRLYVSYDSPIGTFSVGYVTDGPWGTVFGDYMMGSFKINYTGTTGKFKYSVGLYKEEEWSYTAFNTASTQADKDYDKLTMWVKYADKNIDAGLLYAYFNKSVSRNPSNGNPTNDSNSYKRRWHALVPYVKATIGPVFIQSELGYGFGKWAMYDDNSLNGDVTINSLEWWIDATATFGPVYVGGTVAYLQGQGTDATVNNTGASPGGREWSPTLILWNQDRAYWVGGLGYNGGNTWDGGTGNSSSPLVATNGAANAWIYQARGGVKPVDKLDVCLAVTFAQADTLNATPGYVSKDYGWEVDVTGTYKLTNNLTYMLGAGYLITGDFFKGTNSNNKVTNDYLVTNKLTLTF
ncbi:MAG: hypothetical protein AB2L12_08495 [Smithellaceae bacterium]